MAIIAAYYPILMKLIKIFHYCNHWYYRLANVQYLPSWKAAHATFIRWASSLRAVKTIDVYKRQVLNNQREL